MPEQRAGEVAADGAVPTTRYVRLTLRPSTLHEANEYVAVNHRHHKPVRGCRFCIAVIDDNDMIRGIAIVGRPTSRMAQRDPGLAEVTRLCTDGTPNACSMLYAAAWRAWRAMGGTRLGTYILESEDGTSLKAAGWRWVRTTDGGSWDRPSRARTDKAPTVPKDYWEVAA